MSTIFLLMIATLNDIQYTHMLYIHMVYIHKYMYVHTHIYPNVIRNKKHS